MSERQVVRTWNVLGTIYPVIRTETESGNEGENDPVAGEIRVSPTIPSIRFWEVESHELGHNVSEAISLKRTLQDVFGLSAEVALKIEEEWLTKWLPVYLDTLHRNGHLFPPPGPTTEVKP